MFEKFTRWFSLKAGSPITFCLALFIVLTWVITGPLFNFNDTWQLLINTATTIITFFMVFLIQNSQNRDTTAIQIKLDELLRAMKGTNMELFNIEELTDKEIDLLHKRYEAMTERNDNPENRENNNPRT
jgi:low affinity Fe/Cu permease